VVSNGGPGQAGGSGGAGFSDSAGSTGGAGLGGLNLASLPNALAGGSGGGGGGDAGGYGRGGGNGGGAIEIRALGRVTVNGEALANGSGGFGGNGGYAGSLGSAGAPGQTGGVPFLNTGLNRGGYGGAGGNGGPGGAGGAGGPGGGGAGGAGGAVKILGSVITGSGGIDSSRGAGGSVSNQGGNGRLIVGSLGSSGGSPTVTNATSVADHFDVPIMSNPFVAGYQTPLIAPDATGTTSMIGGASAYGLLPSSVLGDPKLAALIAGHPAGSTAFLDLVPVGPQGFAVNYEPTTIGLEPVSGFEMLMLVSFGSMPLTDPMLNRQPLQTFGFANDVEFGGSGLATMLSSLGVDGVFATLVADTNGPTPVSFFDGSNTWSANFDGAGVLYNNGSFVNTAVDEPATPAVPGIGLLGLVIARGRWRRGPATA
jgi:hypothetical protein